MFRFSDIERIKRDDRLRAVTPFSAVFQRDTKEIARGRMATRNLLSYPDFARPFSLSCSASSKIRNCLG